MQEEPHSMWHTFSVISRKQMWQFTISSTRECSGVLNWCLQHTKTVERSNKAMQLACSVLYVEWFKFIIFIDIFFWDVSLHDVYNFKVRTTPENHISSVIATIISFLALIGKFINTRSGRKSHQHNWTTAS